MFHCQLVAFAKETERIPYAAAALSRSRLPFRLLFSPFPFCCRFFLFLFIFFFALFFIFVVVDVPRYSFHSLWRAAKTFKCEILIIFDFCV